MIHPAGVVNCSFRFTYICFVHCSDFLCCRIISAKNVIFSSWYVCRLLICHYCSKQWFDIGLMCFSIQKFFYT